MPRRLAPEESALWKKVAATVTPLPQAKAPLVLTAGDFKALAPA